MAIAIAGNIAISVALNTQKLAHQRIEKAHDQGDISGDHGATQGAGPSTIRVQRPDDDRVPLVQSTPVEVFATSSTNPDRDGEGGPRENGINAQILTLSQVERVDYGTLKDNGRDGEREEAGMNGNGNQEGDNSDRNEGGGKRNNKEYLKSKVRAPEAFMTGAMPPRSSLMPRIRSSGGSDYA